MKRIALTDGSNTWFDEEKAECYKEDTYWNGQNHISKATGSQTEHESIYVTAGGKYILNQWSQWQGSTDKYSLITIQQAAEWFVKNEYQDDELPDIFKEEVANLEIK